MTVRVREVPNGMRASESAVGLSVWRCVCVQEDKGGVTATQKWFMSLVAGLKKRNIAEQTGAANEQHYEVNT